MSTHKRRKPPAYTGTDRDGSHYPFPIPSREEILQVMSRHGKPVSLETLERELGISEKHVLMAFMRRLRAMERDGQLLRNRRGLFGLVDKMDMVCGTVTGHPDGYGFLTPEAGGADLFLPPKTMRQVLHGDRVLARVTGVDMRGRREGVVIEVLERSHKTVVGRYRYENQFGFVVPADKRISQDIYIPPENGGKAMDGQIVVAEITQQPTRHSQPMGVIVKVLGEHMAPGMEIEVAIHKHGLPHIWPDAVKTETSVLPAEVTPADARGRVDLRKTPLVTIDGEDARDYDDAVYCERQGKDWRLVVAIADVSHYVKPVTALDGEAYRRGNSVYFPQRVIPMLPEALSNHLCSLKPDVDRLCMVCDVQISRHGRIGKYRFYKAVMRSHARLTYDQVAAMVVDGDNRMREQHAATVPHLDNLYSLYHLLHKVRMQRGAVDFELPETRIVYDENRKIEKIVPVERNDAHRLIEECMLAANVCAAEYLKKHKVPAPYRIHEGPSPEKLGELREFLKSLGLSLGGGDNPEAQDYSRLIASVSARRDARLIQMVLLRSLSQAVYSPDNIGHFALGYDNYTHFTSPIRRYPDLLVHRAIKHILKKNSFEISQEQAMIQGQHCSTTERRADEAVRDVIRWLKTEYMMDKVGEEFSGMISGVTNFGIFVELSDIFIDGLVHITALGNDYYHFDATGHRLTGERTRKVYQLGDMVRIRVTHVNLDEARIDFELVEHLTHRKKTGKKRRVSLSDRSSIQNRRRRKKKKK